MAKRRAPGETDFRDLRNAAEPAKDEGRTGDEQNRRWWTFEGKAAAESAATSIEFLQKHQTARIRQYAISSRLYGNIPVGASMSAAWSRLQAATAAKERVTYNAIQSITDTLVSRIGENKPRPYYLTSGGDYREQKRAKEQNKYVEGVFYETKTYDLGLDVFRDAAVFGDGFAHAYNRNGRTHHERVLPSELWVDEVEAQYGKPRSMFRVKLIDRDELAAYFPEKKSVIMKATPSTSSQARLGPNIADMVTVAEGWRLGTEDESGEMVGGKRIMVLVDSHDVLVEPEDWPFPFFPFARLRWSPGLDGYWSQGLAEQLQGEQIELNKELYLIQRSMHLAGTLKVLIKTGSKIVKEQLNNDIGGLITYTGDKPEFYCPEPINPVYFENVNRLIDRMSRKAGVGEMSSAARKPAGLNSGAALREFQDIEADRHRATQRANDNFYMELAAIDVSLARELPASAKVRAPNSRGFSFVKAPRQKGEEFVLQCFPVSKLPRDPAGRLQTIQEYIQAGFITPRQGRRALDFPDLETVESLANAQEDIITKVLDAIVDDGEYSPPEPTDDLELASEMVLEYIQRYRANDLEEDKLELLRTFSAQIKDLMDAAAAIAAQKMGPMAGAPPSAPGAPGPANGPQAKPMPPPTSDLLPNAPGAVAS